MTEAAYDRLAKPDASTTLAGQFYAILEDAIVTGILEPGARILVDDLAAHFGTSRIPVREALHALDANGWVTIKPRVGAFVTERTRAELSDLFELRLLVEPQVSRLAAERRTDAQLEELGRLVEDGATAAGGRDSAAFGLVNNSFHVVLAQSAHNALLERVIASSIKRASFYLGTVPQSRIDDSATDHEELVEAIRFRDADRAAEVTIRHIEETEKDIRGSLDRNSNIK